MINYEPLSKRPTGGIPPREVLRHGITESALDGETALFDVLPGVGKSRSIPKFASGTTIPITVLTNLTDNYDQFERWGREDGVTVEKLPTRDLCPTLRDYNPAYTEAQTAIEAREARDLGWPASAIHREFDLPCDEENVCPFRERINEIDPGGPELLVGHFTQAYNPNYLEGRVAIIDERAFNNYVGEIKNPGEKAEEFIATLDDFPFSEARRPETGEKQERGHALGVLEEEGLTPHEHVDSIGEFHSKAPLAAYAIYRAERMGNGLCATELPGDRMAAFDTPLGGDDGGSVWILDPPDFSKAEAVIALDASPCVSEWQGLLGDDLTHRRLFDADQRNQYLSEQGYDFRQLNGYVWGVSNTDEVQVSKPKCEAYLREVHRKHGQRPDIITSNALLAELEDLGLEHLWRDDLHYGDLRGRNDLADSELLVVLGSPSRRDRDIQFPTALLGECAKPAIDSNGERLTGHCLDYQSDIANDILRTTRRGEVFQAAMRAGRTDDSEATVYIATGLVPEWLETERVGSLCPDGSFDACYNPRRDSERAVLKELWEEDGISGREVSRRANLPKTTAVDALNRLRDDGLVEKRGRGRGSKWLSDGAKDANIAGETDLTRMADFPYNNSMRGSRPFSESIESRPEHIDPHNPADPRVKYPRWMREIQRQAQSRWIEEQIKQRHR